jgi:surface antigen
VVGAAAGAAVGSNVGGGLGRTVAIATGTLLGAALGSSIGESLDRADRLYHEQTAQHALETAKSGTTKRWHNPDSGHAGTVTPLNVSQVGDDRYCREYRQSIIVGDRVEEAYGTACRQEDGTWMIRQ